MPPPRAVRSAYVLTIVLMVMLTFASDADGCLQSNLDAVPETLVFRTPHLEHSRLTQMWAAYDSLTNSFAIEGLRYMIAAANRLGKPELAAQWGGFRDGLIVGLDNSLECTTM